jgi:catechol 2,3-dioxygenase-like lactoylglutathione lyase family enzyme
MTVVNHVGHCVTDLERSRRFYESVLGFSHVHDLEVPDGPAATLLRVPPPVGMTACYLRLGTFTLELLAFAREGNDPRRDRSFTEPGPTHLSVTVADLPATCRLAERHGGDVLEDTEIAGRAILIRDPDGQVIELLPESVG